jgi:hypothetical protein
MASSWLRMVAHGRTEAGDLDTRPGAPPVLAR